MSEKPPFTVKSFYDFVAQRKLMASKCLDCGHVNLPPRPFCEKCMSSNIDWMEIKGKGKIETYTVIHVSPKKFVELAPYIVCIATFQDGARITGMLRDIKPEDVKVGMDVTVNFTTYKDEPMYLFKPA